MIMRRVRHSHHRRSFVLIAVLVIVGSALLVVTGLLFTAQADLAGQANASGAIQSRALAWSGVQAVMSRLHDQRSRILDGELPRVDREYVLYEGGAVAGVARLLPFGRGEPYLLPEAGRLDLNTIDAVELADTGLVSTATAEAITAHRDSTLGRPFQSVAELLLVPGVAPEILYGDIAELTVMDDALGDDTEVGEDVAARFGDDALRGLADVVTVYSFEPALQRDGKLQINLNQSWSDELGRRLDDRFGEGAGQIVKQIMDGGTTFDDDAKIFQVLRFLDTPIEQWPDIVDAVTTESGDYHFGRLDINSASPEALAALPGLDEEQASQIVQVRERLSFEERATVVWPAMQGIIEPEAYDQLAGRITTRCWTYRVRIAAGEIDADNIGDPEAPLEHPVIYEAVIDLSAPRPRVAYLREITLLQTAALLAAHVALGASGEGEMEDGSVRSEEVGGDSAGPLTDDEGEWPDDPASGEWEGSELPGDQWEGDWEGDADDSPARPDAGSDGRAGPAGVDGGGSERVGSSESQGRRIGRWRSGG